jgi:hypothetical protein
MHITADSLLVTALVGDGLMDSCEKYIPQGKIPYK